MLAQKGFLGPIGDDLPSLIPLVFALALFFGVFSQTFEAFDSKNTLFSDSLSIVRLSEILVSNSYINGIEKFMEKCETAKSISSLNWKAGLIPLQAKKLEQKTQSDFFSGIDVFSLEGKFFNMRAFEPGLDQQFYCSNTTEPLTYTSENITVRFYPVALEVNLLNYPSQKFFVKPMLLVIVAWK